MTGREDFLRGGTEALCEGVLEVTRAVQGVHEAVLDSVDCVAPLSAPVRHTSRWVYAAIRGATRVGGGAVSLGLALGRPAGGATPLRPWQQATLGACNAAFGDLLAEGGSPWALPMALCRDGEPLVLTREALASRLPAPRGHVVVFLHGLGNTDASWLDASGGSFGAALEASRAGEGGCSALALRYNTGVHLHENGRQLDALLEALVEAWPVPLERLTLVGYSMGGLLARSAGHASRAHARQWRRRLAGVACIGSPHRGTLLERGGHLLTRALGVLPHTRPVGLLGGRRSAGIKDLRHGSLAAGDWQGRHPDSCKAFEPQPVDWLEGVPYLLVATSVDPLGVAPLAETLGDGLVSRHSAHHPRVSRPEAPGQVTRVHLAGIGHLAQPHHPRVLAALQDWLAARA
jgi:pimeloyl-ACP methyl ester carboxylesterase